MRRLVRVTTKIDKFTMLDHILHLFGIHLLKESEHQILGKYYCRICGKYFDSFEDKGNRRNLIIK